MGFRYRIGPWVWQDNAWAPPFGTVGAVDLRSLADQARPGAAPAGVGFFAMRPEAASPGGAYVTLDDSQTAGQLAAWPVAVTRRKPLEALYEALTVKADPSGLSGPKPLQPDHRRRLRLILAGQLVSQERLTPHSAAWPIVQTTLQLDYRAIRAAALAPGSPDAVFHRRWLGYQVRKLGVAHTSLIPLDLPPEAPIEPTTTLTDNFDRANADPPSNSAEGWAWAEVAGDRWAIVSNKLTLATGSSAAHQLRAQSDLAGADQTVGADITWPLATTRIAGLAGRYASAADTCYWGYARADSNNCRIGKRIAAVDTVLSTYAAKPTAGSPVACALTVDGSALRWVIAGVCDMNLTDTAISSGARAGCKLLAFTADNGLIDNWQAADIAPGGGACNSLPLLGTGC